MARKNKGQSSDAGQPKRSTGIPTKISDDNSGNDLKLTEQYTDDDNQIADGVRTGHPNRNVDKEDATGAGGYRN